MYTGDMYQNTFRITSIDACVYHIYILYIIYNFSICVSINMIFGVTSKP